MLNIAVNRLTVNNVKAAITYLFFIVFKFGGLLKSLSKPTINSGARNIAVWYLKVADTATNNKKASYRLSKNIIMLNNANKKAIASNCPLAEYNTSTT
jgi:hypothetical protein